MSSEDQTGELGGDGYSISISVGPEFEMTDRVRSALEELSEAFGIDEEVAGFGLDPMDPMGLKSICVIKTVNCGGGSMYVTKAGTGDSTPLLPGSGGTPRITG